MILPSIFAGKLDENGYGFAYMTPLLGGSVRLRSTILNGKVFETTAFVERYHGESNMGRTQDMLMVPIGYPVR